MSWPPAGRNVRVFVGTVSTETNTFAPVPTDLADFEVVRLAEYEASGFREAPDFEEIARLTTERGWELVFGLQASAQPSGVTVRAAYETMRDELLDRLQAETPVDMVLLPLHGAMVAEGYDHCEVDLVRRVRGIVGPEVPIGVGFDLHCHFTEEIVALADVLVAYKEYPHTDLAERAADLFRLTAATAAGEIRPSMALFDCRMIGIYTTPVGPMRGFVDAMQAAEARGDVLSLSLAHGFPWGDVPALGCKMLAITDGDAAGAERAARAWGMRFHALRREVTLDPLSLDEAIDKALSVSGPGGPMVIADQADNTGGGAPGDSTYALAALLDRGATDVALGMIYDPEVVRQAGAAGVGARIDVRLGGKLGATSGSPLDVAAEVLAVNPALVQNWPQTDGPLWMRCGAAVALRIAGLDVVVNDVRVQVFGHEVFSSMGIDPVTKRALVVKSTQHFYAAFAPLAREVVYMGGPGAIAPRMTDIPLRRADLNKYPWVEEPFG